MVKKASMAMSFRERVLERKKQVVAQEMRVQKAGRATGDFAVVPGRHPGVFMRPSSSSRYADKKQVRGASGRASCPCLDRERKVDGAQKQ